MRAIIIAAASFIALAAVSPAVADEITDAIDQGRKAYGAGDLAGAKQSLDLASQLIGQKNAETFGKLLPAPLAGWKAEEVQTAALGAVGFGASTASRTYTKPNGDSIEVQITGDSAMIMQFGAVLANPQIAGAMGKIVMVGNQRAIQNRQGDLHMIVNNKYLIVVQGSGAVADKLAYVRAVDIARLSKM
jgi:hypothetical protein